MDPKQELELMQGIIRGNMWLRHILPIQSKESPDEMVDKIISMGYDEDVTWTVCFEPSYYARLCHAGFLPISLNVSVPRPLLSTPPFSEAPCVLAPKLHTRRCVLALSDLHVKKAARRAAHAFHISVDRAFDDVAKACVEQHGVNWLYPTVVGALRKIHLSKTLAVRVHSVEVWREGKLVAGEIGCSTGEVYTSMTGFCREKNAGSVQLLTLGKLLTRCGFTVLDFGMGMEYKTDLGAKDIDRPAFVALLRQHRDKGVHTLVADMERCSDVIKSVPSARPKPQRNPDSKTQRKRMAKKEKKAQLRMEARLAKSAAKVASV